MNHRWWGIILALTLVLAACTSSGGSSSPPAAENSGPNSGLTGEGTPGSTDMQGSGAPAVTTPDQIKAPHFVDSYPSHGESFSQVPEAVVINFNFNLHENSFITVTKDGVPVSIDRTTIDPNGLTMRAPIVSQSEDGLYLANYRACWPDGSCHDGHFAFRVDSKIAGYMDLTGKESVSIEMRALKFWPDNITISRGTMVTWTNQESELHYVNSDPHPSHNALPGLNSPALGSGETYSFTFTETGEWGYHCSAHYPQGMIGRIIVVE